MRLSWKLKLLRLLNLMIIFLVFILHEKADPNVFVWSSQLYDYYVYGLYTQLVLRTELATSPKIIFLKYNVFKC